MKKVSSISTNPSKDNPVQQKINEINDLLAQDLVRFPSKDTSSQYLDEIADMFQEDVDRDRLNKWLSVPPHTPFTGFKKQ